MRGVPRKARTGFRSRAPGLAACFVLVIGALLAGCDIPKDPEGTLDRVRSEGVLRAGVSFNPPWTGEENGIVRGIEADLVEGFARTLGVRVEWTRGAESTLVEAMEAYRIDLLAGGLTDQSPWRKRVGTTQPWHGRQVLAVAPGESALLLALDRFLAAEKNRRGGEIPR